MWIRINGIVFDFDKVTWYHEEAVARDGSAEGVKVPAVILNFVSVPSLTLIGDNRTLFLDWAKTKTEKAEWLNLKPAKPGTGTASGTSSA